MTPSVNISDLREKLERARDGQFIGLLPCPFCGGRAEIIEADEAGDAAYAVQCQTRGCEASSLVAFALKDGVEALLVEKWNRRTLLDQAARVEAQLVAANSELAEYAKTVGNLRAALSTCQQSLKEQALARADPTMPRLAKPVLERLRADSEAAYAMAEDRDDRVAAHGLSLLCDWQEGKSSLASTTPPAKGEMNSGPWSVFATMNGQRTRLVLPGNPDSPYQTPYRDAAERFVETLRDLSPAYTDVRIEPASTTPPAKDSRIPDEDEGQ